jgi:hypothetical protein
MLENEENWEAFILSLQVDCSYHVAHIIKLVVLEVPCPNYHRRAFFTLDYTLKTSRV